MSYQLYFIITLTILTYVNTFCQESGKLVVAEKVEVITTLAREPMLAEHPNGALYITGYRNASQSPQLWKSTDSGTSWSKVDVGTREEGADGNSDVDLVIDEGGVIYFLSMKFTQVPEDTTGFDWTSMKGEHISIGISKDDGASWDWTYLSQNDFDDRPWVAVAANGSVHVIWNDGKGVHHTVSEDQGKTWEKRPDIHPKGGSSHLAAGPNGQLAVRVTPTSASGFVFDQGVDLIQLSLDNGNSWQSVTVPGVRDWSSNMNEGTPRWVEPIGWDPDGNLYYLWSEGKQLKLGISENNGEDWDIFPIATADDVIYFPYLNVSDDAVACSWVSGSGKEVRHHAAVVQMEEGEIAISKLSPLKLTDITSRFGSDENLATGGEYFPVKALSEGDYGMVTTIQNHAANRLGFTWWRLKVE